MNRPNTLENVLTYGGIALGAAALAIGGADLYRDIDARPNMQAIAKVDYAQIFTLMIGSSALTLGSINLRQLRQSSNN